MNIRLEKIGAGDITEINRIQKLAFRESYEKYRFCPAYEVSDEEVPFFYIGPTDIRSWRMTL